MRASTNSFLIALSWAAALLPTLNATSVPALSFEELTDRSELVVTGQINRAWAEWDGEQKYIWTHYELTVSEALKGSAGTTVVLSEPGGVVGNRGMNIAGAVGYRSGESVLLFIQRMANGYMRTTGWSQGKFATDKTGLVHATGRPAGLEMAAAKPNTAATSLRMLDGMRVSELRAMIARRVQTQSSGAR